MTDIKTTTNDIKDGNLLKEQEKAVIEAVRSLQYGSVEIVIHEGRIMEVTRKQRVRFRNGQNEASDAEKS